MKRWKAGLSGAVLAAAIATLLVWSPWTRVRLSAATVVWPVARHAMAPVAGKADVMAVIISGDGGWADLDRRLGVAFIDRGIPVLGINSMTYYWRERDPVHTAQELDALMNRYLATWDKRRIWLIGFSFGADVLPTIVNHLSAANRARIAQLVLLSPSRDATFEIELEGYMITPGWFQDHLKNTLQWFNPIAHYLPLPPLRALAGTPPVMCYYGLDDADDSLCTAPGLPAWVRVHAKGGDHHFDGGYQPLAWQLLAELPADTGAPARH